MGPDETIPANHVALVTPNDSTRFTPCTRGISFVVAGDLAIETAGEETVVIPNGTLAAGVIHPIKAVRILSTGTTATGIVRYW